MADSTNSIIIIEAEEVENSTESTSSSSTTTPQLSPSSPENDAATKQQNQNQENAIIIDDEEKIPKNIFLEGDAAEICRNKPKDVVVVENDHLAQSQSGAIVDEPPEKQTRRSSRLLDDDEEEEFFREFIDDDTAYASVDENQVWLDTYNADLNLKIFPENRLMAEPLHEDGFAYMIAGVRASYGVNRGKVGFEIKVLEHLDISQIRPEETHFPHELRVGWSTDTASLRLGESHFAYGYCGSSGRKVSEWRFAPYAEPFDEIGDVVTCLVDFDKKEVEFYKNGQRSSESGGVAFSLGREWDDDQEAQQQQQQHKPPLFPHVATKNVRFEANFGNLETPWFPLPEGFTFINQVPLAERIRGPVPPKSKKDCKVLMMVGLPGCGKTTWVRKFCDQNPNERWTVLSAPMVLEHMKAQGVARKKLTQSRWDVMMGATVKCLNKLMSLACRKKKNYIIDQTNCYPAARRKKILAFQDFYRKAVVLVPRIEDHADRLHQQAMTEGKQMPPEAMLEMKACFALPEESDELFDEIEFVELDRDRAQQVVGQYNEEGKAFKPPEPKKRRGGGADHHYHQRRHHHQNHNHQNHNDHEHNNNSSDQHNQQQQQQRTG